MATRYALMLLTQAELVAEFDSSEEAEAALIQLIDADETLLEEAGIIPMDESGRPVGAPVKRAALSAA